VPDLVANVATDARWWWTLLGDVHPATDAAFAKIASTLGSLVTQVLDTAARDRVRPRTVALAMSAARSAEVSSRHA
jgi:glutamate dehydrogenase (NAD(P)+)